MFIDAVRKENKLNMTYTWNGALANETTFNANLNFFAQMGNWGTLTDIQIIELFNAAFDEEPTVALRLLFASRDVRGGQKVRRVFQKVIGLANVPKLNWFIEHLDLIPEYGYWGDLYAFYTTPYWNTAVVYWCNQIKQDLLKLKTEGATANISLAAKWAPSERQNMSDKDKIYTKHFVQHFSSPKQYRKILTTLRRHLDIVETKMSNNQWDNVNYSTVPGKAFLKYRNAFARHDSERFNKFLESDNKVNAQVLTPYDVVRRYYKKIFSINDMDPSLEKIWKNLDNVFGEPAKKLLPVCDCSGSMYTDYNGILPFHVAAALTIYTAQRNVGPFHNLFMEFSRTAKFYELNGGSLFIDLKILNSHSEIANTNLQSVFDEILSVAISQNVSPEDMPDSVLIMSDMQFDRACGSIDKRNIDVIKEKFEIAGYECPTIIFWNLNSANNYPATKYDNQVLLMSGYSEQMLRYVLMNDEIETPYQLMMSVVNNPRYENIEW